MSKQSNLGEVASVFFRLGLIAFGGPAAHIAMMEDEIVEKRKWMDRQHFLDLMGATNLIPGPNSTEMTMHCGHERAGIPGLFVAGACFIFPAVVITAILGYLYVTYGQLPSVEPFLLGIKPAVLALIASAIYKLGKKALKGVELAILGVLTVIASLMGVNEIVALLSAGVIGTMYFYFKSAVNTGKVTSLIPLFFFQGAVVKLSTMKIFLSFLKVGAILYGSGYVLFAYLDAELVSSGVLSRPELMDAIAIGQFTPGPVLSTATFIGYQLGGISGAIAATFGMFLPSFLFVWIMNPLVPKMRQSKVLGYFLDCVNVAAVAVMVAVLFSMAKESLIDWRSFVIAGLSAAAIFGPKKISVMWIVFGSAVLGYLLYMV